MTQESELVCVRTCQGVDVAEIYKSKLEAHDIPVLLRYDSAAKLFGLTVDGLGEVRIMVPRSHLAEAQELLIDLEDGEEASNSDV